MSTTLGIRYYVHVQYDAGYGVGHAAAVATGDAQRDLDAAIHLKKETDQCTQLAAKDTAVHQKEQKYAKTLDAAERRMHAGTDRLCCPASRVQPSGAPESRPLPVDLQLADTDRQRCPRILQLFSASSQTISDLCNDTSASSSGSTLTAR